MTKKIREESVLEVLFSVLVRVFQGNRNNRTHKDIFKRTVITGIGAYSYGSHDLPSAS